MRTNEPGPPLRDVLGVGLSPLTSRRASDLLDRIAGVKDPCDLDLLLFFHRHPRAVLTSERLAVYVGYDLSRVATSLETLIAGELLTRTQRPTGSARMYLLAAEGRRGGWLNALLRLASTRPGRLAVLAALAGRRPSGDAARGETQDQRAPGRGAAELRHA